MKRTILLLVSIVGAQAQVRSDPAWVAAWTAGPQQQVGTLKPIQNQTLRMYVPVAVGASKVRVRFSNEYGNKPLLIGAATIGLLGADGAIESSSLHKLTFANATTVQIPVGAPAYSDSIDLRAPASGSLAISIFLPRETMPETYHRPVANQDNPGPLRPAAELVGPGDLTRELKVAGGAPSPYLFLTEVDVRSARVHGVVAVMGTTRTAGPGHWPDLLTARLRSAGRNVAVVNASMVANPLTRPYPGGGEAGLARFDRDVLRLPGISHVVIADAINDIGQPGGNVVAAAEMPNLETLSAAYLQLAARAHQRGVKVLVATLMPFEGVPFAGFYSPEKEKLRVALNEWIRGSKAFDGLIDLDALMRDPKQPSKFIDGLHTANNFGPNDAGERKIADAIDLKLFR